MESKVSGLKGGGGASTKEITRLENMIVDLQHELKKRAMLGHIDQVKAELSKKMDEHNAKTEIHRLDMLIENHNHQI